MSATRGPLVRGPVLPYKVLAGVVPARGGWLVASAKLQGVTLSPEDPTLVRSLIDVLDTKPSFSIVALGAPIGMHDHPDEGPRPCDVEAKAILGWPRASAILDPPTRHAVKCSTDYASAREANGGRLSSPQWRRMPRTIEVDNELAPYWQRIVFETDPELSYYQLNGERSLRYSKHSSLGVEERRDLLGAKLPWLDRILGGDKPISSVPSLLDAAICLWASRRIMAKAVRRLPEFPVWDSTGLRMEIVF